MLINKENYPNVTKAFREIDMDQGVNALESYEVPARMVRKLSDAETFLSSLSEKDFETFCIGEAEEQDALKKKGAFAKAAAAVLDWYFDNGYESRDSEFCS